MQPVLVGTDMKLHSLVSSAAQGDGFLEAPLVVADQGEAVTVEYVEEMEFLCRQVSPLQLDQTLLEELLALLEVALREVADIEHREQIAKLRLLVGSLDARENVLFLG